jgi:hypothetical protein
MFRTQIYCGHQYALLLRPGDAEEPILSEIAKLVLDTSIDHLGSAQDITERDAFALDGQNPRGLKTFAQKTIERFSHVKDKEKIGRYVEDHRAVGETFAFDIPVSLL